MNVMEGTFTNPLSDLINDDVYEILKSKNLINEKLVRDFSMRKRFKALRAKKISVSDAIETIRDEYPYLQYDSIRKIIYSNKFND